jgi:uncharacterized flavoprotein (TIGR03862 family)
MSASLAIVGGGPAGLMAAEVALAAGVEVDLYERMGSVGRKFLLAGKGGLNLTHAEPPADFVSRYRERADEVGRWLRDFDADALRTWARGLGVETFVGTSGRVFPSDLKAAPLLRGWVRRLRAQGLHIHVNCRLARIENGSGRHALEFTDGTTRRADAVVLALGGGSWPELGSDGAWFDMLRALDVPLRSLRPSNGGFECAWTAHFCRRFAGQPVKPVSLRWLDEHARAHERQGEFIVTEKGIEGGLIYAASADLRETIHREGHADVLLDLAPGRAVDALTAALSAGRGKRSIGEHLRRAVQLDGVRAGLLFEFAHPSQRNDPAALATLIKRLPLRVLRPRPLAEAISSAGGVRFDALDDELMLRAHPGLFCAGEMLDWEAPTGGYLLTACLAGGRVAGRAAAQWAIGRKNLSP